MSTLGFTHSKEAIFTNLCTSKLIEHAVKYTGCELTESGALSVVTGKHTGRAAKDKYVVTGTLSNSTIDWENNIRKMSPSVFTALKQEIIKSINQSERLYISKANVGSIENLSINAELYSTHPEHSLFFKYLMRSDGFDPSKSFGTYRIFHAPDFNANAQKLELRSETAIAMDLEAKEILICGTLYAGEIKKSLFSVLNYILPDKNILPMHAGSNVDPKTNDVSVFFGLSGTGKTTLSTQESRLLIGDDEHGLSDQGIFNFEGGCYAKTYKLSKESEPEIFKAANTYGALLENVVLAKNNAPDFDDMSLAENGRCAYPLNFIEGIEPSSKGGIPSNMFFLTADAFGVLPPVSLLSNEQAKYYFLSGYTAKLAGTEMGVTEPQATFSTCFGAPFMMRPAGEYAELLGNYIKKYNIKVWLINTGWSGGVYGVGSRFPLKTTRRIIDAIQHKELDNASFETEAFFGLKVPTSISGVDAKLLSPIQNWSDSDAFKDVAKKLATMFKENFKRFSEKNLNLIQAGPRA